MTAAKIPKIVRDYFSTALQFEITQVDNVVTDRKQRISFTTWKVSSMKQESAEFKYSHDEEQTFKSFLMRYTALGVTILGISLYPKASRRSS